MVVDGETDPTTANPSLPDTAIALEGATLPTADAAATPVTLRLTSPPLPPSGVTVPRAPIACTPVSATVVDGDAASTAPVPSVPEIWRVALAETVPACPMASTPVSD